MRHCPFCGKSATDLVHITQEREYWFVRCELVYGGCAASGPVSEKSAQDAVAKWNTQFDAGAKP